MKLTDIVHRWQETHVLAIFQGKGHGAKPSLATDSISLARNRIQTTKCTRENCGMSGGSEELHVVLPRWGWRTGHTAAAAGRTCPSLPSTCCLAPPCSYVY